MQFESKKHNGIYTGWTERHIFTLNNTAHGKYSVYANVTEEYGGEKLDRSISIADNVSRAETEKWYEENA